MRISYVNMHTNNKHRANREQSWLPAENLCHFWFNYLKRIKTRLKIMIIAGVIFIVFLYKIYHCIAVLR